MKIEELKPEQSEKEKEVRAAVEVTRKAMDTARKKYDETFNIWEVAGGKDGPEARAYEVAKEAYEEAQEAYKRAVQERERADFL